MLKKPVVIIVFVKKRFIWKQECVRHLSPAWNRTFKKISSQLSIHNRQPFNKWWNCHLLWNPKVSFTSQKSPQRSLTLG